MIWIQVASLMMFLAVILGAFGAHAIHGKLSDNYMDIYETAVLYQFIHALGLFVVAWLSTICKDEKVTIAGILMLAGILMFSGSLYILSLTGIRWLGALTPVGGICFLAAWAILFLVKI